MRCSHDLNHVADVIDGRRPRRAAGYDHVRADAFVVSASLRIVDLKSHTIVADVTESTNVVGVSVEAALAEALKTGRPAPVEARVRDDGNVQGRISRAVLD